MDIIRLVKDSVKVSFARVQHNQKAVLHRGWGPRALNMNVLLHPEIMASKPASSDETPEILNALTSSLPASELNLMEGLAGTLVQRIVIKTNKEAHLKGMSIADSTKKGMKLPRKIWKIMKRDAPLDC
jgi:hypothetical protein